MEAAPRRLTGLASFIALQSWPSRLHKFQSATIRASSSTSHGPFWHVPQILGRPQLSQIACKTHSLYVRDLHTSPSLLSAKKFSYGIAASYTAKGRRYDPSKNVFNFDPYTPIIQRRKDKNTRPDSGQDAFFISRIGKSGDVAFGVADGVGGWADSGVDPADFSHGFCDYMAHTAWTYLPGDKSPVLSARGLMQKGYEAIANDETVKAGGSTACIGIAKEDGSLEVANLGDSGFVQLRLNAVHNHSESQTHAFNTPYQLSIIPPKMKAKNAAFGGAQLHDLPKDASVTKHSLRHGDVIIFATDGVWDNLSSQDMLKIASKLMLASGAWEPTKDGIRVGERLAFYTMTAPAPSDTQGVSSLQSFLAVGIASEAKAASTNTKLDGPFAKEVQRYYPEEDWKGGKVDDICVVVAIVVEEGK